MKDQFRLDDKTFARQGPHPHTLWLDDMYMGIPALAQMGKLTGDAVYYDDAVRQVKQFADRMFNHEKGLFMHGWAEEMEIHSEFCWARANGWAMMAMIEVLDVLPNDYKGRNQVLQTLREHIQGIAACQSGSGLWHQLLDRNDSYLETSASAIYTYCIARAINKGYVDAKVYGSMVLLGWNAVSTRVNAKGQVEGTCVGTGMGFDPAFYYYRPQSALAAHGYGPVLLAGTEVIKLLNSAKYAVEGGSVKFYAK
jgi:unsaturated rhamnogalacturonyl hydrolase